MPEIAPGCAGVPGLTVTAKVLVSLVPQALDAVTVIFPFCPALPEVTVIAFVPAPEVIVHPVGTVQVYEVAFGTAEILYVSPVIPGQTIVVPVIAPGVAGVPGFTVTAKVLTALVPHELEAFTVIFPFCPKVPVVTVIEFVPAPEVIVHPVGTDQLYVVTVGSLTTLNICDCEGHVRLVPAIVPGITGVPGLTVIVIVLPEATVGNAQGALEVIRTLTTSPLFKLAVVKIELFDPTFVPLTFHW